MLPELILKYGDMNGVKQRRRFLVALATVTGGTGFFASVVPFIRSMLPSEKTKVSGAPISVDISKIRPGKQQTAQWRGKPVWILRRTDDMLESLGEVRRELRDPDSEVTSQQPGYAQNAGRSIKPEYFVCIGICTHLGCVPTFRPDEAPEDLGEDWHGGYFCPCHGSRFDLAGRVYKGVPAPTNLVVPPYRYDSETVIMIGED